MITLRARWETMTAMPDMTPSDRVVRAHADAYVTALADLNPIVGTMLGTGSNDDRMPDLSPDGHAAEDALARATLAGLDAIERNGAARNGVERRCARLLRDRLTTKVAVSDIGEHLRAVSNLMSPVHTVRRVFTMMPTGTPDDWAVIARRMSAVPAALAGYRATLTEGARRELLAAPRQVDAVLSQLSQWIVAGDWLGWFAEFAAGRTRSARTGTGCSRGFVLAPTWTSPRYTTGGGRNTDDSTPPWPSRPSGSCPVRPRARP